MSMVTLKNKSLTAVIDSFGAELKSVKSSDASQKEFIWCGDSNIWSGTAPVLFPICGGLKDDKYAYNGKEYTLKKHGFGRKVDYTVEKSNDTEAVFLYKSNSDTLAVFPFDFEFRVKFLLEDNSLKITYETKNLTDGNMYFSVGAHEAYDCPELVDDYDIIFDEYETLDAYELDGNLLSGNKNRIITNGKILPLKKEYFEIDALVFKDVKSKSVSLVNRNGGRRIKVFFDGFKYLLLWTKPSGKYLCIEPWCGIPATVGASDDITQKEGIIKLEKNKTHSVTHTIIFE